MASVEKVSCAEKSSVRRAHSVARFSWIGVYQYIVGRVFATKIVSGFSILPHCLVRLVASNRLKPIVKA
jgi:hypothetical protein